MGTDALAVDTGAHGFDPHLLSVTRERACLPLRAWLEHQAAELSAGPGVARTTVVDLTTPSTAGPREHGWLLDACRSTRPARPAMRCAELLTDMRLVGFDPTVFTARPGPA